MKNNLEKAKQYLSGRTANNGKYAAIDQGVISLSNFAASILLARYVSPTELGVYTIGFLAIYFMRGIQNGIIIQPLNTYGAGKSEEAFRPYFSTVALFQAGIGIGASISAALLGWLLISLGNDTLGPTIFVLWFSFLTWQLQEFFRRAFYTRGEVSKAVWISVAMNATRLGLILLLIRLDRLSGWAGLNAIGWGSLAASIVGFLMARSYITTRGLDLPGVWKENWQFGRWILGTSIADWFVVDFYPIMMAGMISFAAAGVYQALQNLVAPIHVLLRAIDTYATPILAKTYDQAGLAKFERYLRLIFLIAGIPVVILLILVMIFAPQLLFLLKGDTYLPYADGIYVMALFYFFLFINRPLQLAFRAVRKGKQVFFANILAAVSMFTIGIWLIRRAGLYGGIGGQALNAFLISEFLLIAYLRWRKKEVSKTLPE